MWKASSALVAAACGSHATSSAAPAIDHALAAALAEADELRAPWRCAALDTPGAPAEQLGHWRLDGHVLTRADAGDGLVIGVVADAGGAAPQTIAALARLRARIDDARPDLVLALGGMGATRGELEATLDTLADHASYPVVALPGDLEPAAALHDAVASLRQRGDLVIDARLARWIEAPGATIATVPGAGAAARLAAGDDGCGWRRSDVAKLYAELTARPGLRVVASSEAPRANAGDEPSGELELAAPAAQPIDVHLHGPTAPAPSPARSGGRDGASVALSPGTADATTRLPDAHSASAGLLAIRGGAWTWRPVGTTDRER